MVMRMDGSHTHDYIGLASEMAALATAILGGTEVAGAGSTYWATDTNIGYVWDGAAWKAVA